MPCLIWKLSSRVPIMNLASVVPINVVNTTFLEHVTHTFRPLMNLWYSAFKTMIFSRLKLVHILVVSPKKV